jgi:NitT/TauT family transport system substrate-binding protein/sulfonate transport system substrate-binding protein
VRTPRHSRPLFSIAALLAILGLALAACGGGDEAEADDAGAGSTTTAGDSTGSEAPEPFTLRVGFISTGASAWGGPEGYAHSTGQLLDALRPLGVTEIESFGFANGPEASQAITGGSIDIALYGDTPAVNGRAAGLPTRLINQTRVGLSATLYTPAGGVTSIADLAGGTIGVAQGSFMHRFVLGFLEAEGLTDAVTVTNIPVAEYAAALTAGDVAAVVVPWSLAPAFDAQGFKPLVSTLPDYPELAGSSVTVATESLVEDHPGLVEAWNEARGEVLAQIHADPEPYYDFQQPILKVDRSLVAELEDELASYPADPFTEAGDGLLEGTKAFLVDIGAAQSDFEISDWRYAGD